MTPLETLISLVSAITHDLDHPGVNQKFLVETNNHLANLYEVSMDMQYWIIYNNKPVRYKNV